MVALLGCGGKDGTGGDTKGGGGSGSGAGGSGGSMNANSAGQLDPTFSSDGRVTFDSGKGNDRGRWVTQQGADGKVVAVGKSNDDFIVVRYLPNGEPDLAFGNNGVVTTDLMNSGDEGKSVLVQSDQKIVLAGITTRNGNADFGLVRYLTNGQLDTTLAGVGSVHTDIAGGMFYDEGKSLVIQFDGKYVIGGKGHNGTDDDFAVVRYTTNGALDTTFNGTGIVTTNYDLQPNEGNSIAQQPDGKLLLAGQSFNGADDDFAVVRYNTNGSLDDTFQGGVVTTPIGPGTDTAFTVNVQPDGQILVTGNSFDGARNVFTAVRYNTDGTLDDSFDDDGIFTLAVGETNDVCSGSAVQADGKILLAGTAESATSSQLAVARLLPSGALDTTFGTGGVSQFGFDGAGSGAYAMRLQSDGKILVVGDNDNGSDFDIAVARLLVD
ncbi:MAG: hypothetical protein U0271_46210 [Polyangiaceae bacterium]